MNHTHPRPRAAKRSNKRATYGSVRIVERGRYVRIRWREDGKTVERSAKTWDAAENLAVEIHARLAAGGQGSPEGSFAALVEQAIQRSNFASWSEESYAALECVAAHHLIPALSDRPARLVKRDDLQTLLNALYDGGNNYSKHTVSKALKVLRKATELGVSTGVWTVGKNPGSGLKMPASTIESNDVQLGAIALDAIPTEDEVVRLIDAAWKDDPRYGFVVEIAARCGLRWSEILGLQAADFDLDNRSLTVARSRRERIGNTFTVSPTKTKNGVRSVVIPQSSVERLRTFIGEREGQRFLVETSSGRPIRKSQWSNIMVRLRRAAKFPLHISTHDLRHFCGSHWMRLGVPHADITKMMGHANVKITMTLYAHSDNQHLDRAKKII